VVEGLGLRPNRRGDWADHAQVLAVFVLVPSDGMTSGPRPSVAEGGRRGNNSGGVVNGSWAPSRAGPIRFPVALSAFSYFPSLFSFVFPLKFA
jgi:hypothetical protein